MMGDKYSTTVETQGKDFRWISNVMTLNGHEMRHSSARNYFLRAMLKFVNEFNPNLSPETAGEISRSTQFHSAICALLYDAVQAEMNEQDT